MANESENANAGKETSSFEKYISWGLLGCAVFVFIGIIVVMVFVLMYGKNNFLAGAPDPGCQGKGGKLMQDCDKYLQGSEKYIDLINKYADQNNVDPALIAAIAEQESTWNPNAYRYEPKINDSSYGLMQTLYTTAQGMGYSGAPEGLYNPETSIDYGSKYISQMLKANNNDPRLALAAYNGGPGAVSNGQILSSIDYSNKVMARYKKYQECLDQTGAGTGTGATGKGTCIGFESPIKAGFDKYGPYTNAKGLDDTGLDFYAERGSPVYAAKGGKIVYNDNNGYVDPGWSGPIQDRGEILIDHGDGTYSAYRHLSGRNTNLVEGTPVNAGQEIGNSGTANNAAHLHFEILKGTNSKNITEYMNPYYMANCYSGTDQWGNPKQWGTDYYAK